MPSRTLSGAIDLFMKIPAYPFGADATKVMESTDALLVSHAERLSRLEGIAEHSGRRYETNGRGPTSNFIR